MRASDEDTRSKEVDEIIKKVNQDELFLIMGDLNSLSPQDSYDEKQMLAQAKSLGIKKFGARSLRHDVISKLLNSGMIDTGKQFTNEFQSTVPTPYNHDIFHFTRLRLDYIFTTKKLLEHLKFARAVKNKETEKLSDHYPVEAEFNI